MVVTDNWDEGNPYERYIGRWSRRIAPLFLDWLELGAGLRLLDVGCGTGALGGATLDRCAPLSIVGVEPSEGFRAMASETLAGRATILEGNAASIPLDDSSVDVVVSALVLNFIPDLAAAFSEMRRVAAPGGVIAAYVWDYADKMEPIRVFWDTAVELDSAASVLDEAKRFPICDPEALSATFNQAGLSDVRTTALEVDARFTDFDDFWSPFIGGNGPAPAYAMSLTEDRRIALRENLRARLPAQSDGSISLTARAWAVRGMNS